MSSFKGTQAATYDALIVKMVPGYHTLHRLVQVILGNELPETAHILVVGAGTGTEVVGCAAAHPGWSFTAIEPSQDMAALAMEKLKAKGLDSRVEWFHGPIAEFPGEELYDAAISILALHFVSNNGDKLELLTEISNRLAPGAPLLLASYVGDPDTTRTRRLFDMNQAWAVAEGVESTVAKENINLNRKDVFLVPEERVKSLLRDSGFIDVQRIFQSLAMIAWWARTNRG